VTAFERLKKLLGLSGGAGNGSAPANAMIDCEEAAARLFEYLDGELDDISEEEVRRHLEVCEGCYPRAQFEKRFIEALGQSQNNGHAPEELKGRILEAIAQGGAEEG
jgi:anti-sigma factor (TIGR02949 family)